MTVFSGCLKRLSRNPLVWIFIIVFPLVIYMAIGATGGTGMDGGPADIKIGICDLDKTELSGALTRQMALRYDCLDVADGQAIAMLSEQKAGWVLTIPGGYQASILAGEAPELEGASLSLSDVQYMASASAEAATRALLALAAGAGEPELTPLISSWEESSRIDTKYIQVQEPWENAQSWMNFYGWIAMLTAFFMVRTVMTDRRGGFPERIGVLPMTRQRYLLQCVLAVFTLSELSAVLLMALVRLATGYPLPNPAHMLLLFSVYNLFATGLSIGLFSLIKRQANVSFVVVMASTLLSMLGGTYWPIGLMPSFMQKIALFAPTYWLDRGLSNIEAISFSDFWLPVILICAFAFALFMLGSLRRIPIGEDT